MQELSASRNPSPSQEDPQVSVVLPCYRAADLALRSVTELQRCLAGGSRTWEIIVVDDGGGDFPDDPWPNQRAIQLLRLPRNQGKGAAVKAGMLSAKGRVRLYTDVDLPYGVELIPVIVDYIQRRGFHLVIGDRTLPGSVYAHNVGWARGVASGLFSTFVGALVTGGFHDTQCGLKAIRGDVADLLFRLLRLERFAFDVELIYLALKFRVDIKRIPVRLVRNESSSVRLLADSAQGFIDVFRIKYHQLSGAYSCQALEQLVSGEHAAACARSLGDGAC